MELIARWYLVFKWKPRVEAGLVTVEEAVIAAMAEYACLTA